MGRPSESGYSMSGVTSVERGIAKPFAGKFPGSGSRFSPHLQHFVNTGELDARRPDFLPLGHFHLVELQPIGVGKEPRLALPHQLGGGLGRGAGRLQHLTVGQIGDHAFDRLQGVGLVRADDAGGAAFDPAGRVNTGHWLRPVGVEHAACVVGDNAAAVVERHVGQRYAAIADRAEDPIDRQFLKLLGGTGTQGAGVGGIELVLHQLHGGQSIVGIVHPAGPSAIPGNGSSDGASLPSG